MSNLAEPVRASTSRYNDSLWGKEWESVHCVCGVGAFWRIFGERHNLGHCEVCASLFSFVKWNPSIFEWLGLLHNTDWQLSVARLTRLPYNSALHLPIQTWSSPSQKLIVTTLVAKLETMSLQNVQSKINKWHHICNLSWSRMMLTCVFDYPKWPRLRFDFLKLESKATALHHINWTCQCKYALFTRFRIKGVTGTLWRWKIKPRQKWQKLQFLQVSFEAGSVPIDSPVKNIQH